MSRFVRISITTGLDWESGEQYQSLASIGPGATLSTARRPSPAHQRPRHFELGESGPPPAKSSSSTETNLYRRVDAIALTRCGVSGAQRPIGRSDDLAVGQEQQSDSAAAHCYAEGTCDSAYFAVRAGRGQRPR